LVNFTKAQKKRGQFSISTREALDSPCSRIQIKCPRRKTARAPTPIPYCIRNFPGFSCKKKADALLCPMYAVLTAKANIGINQRTANFFSSGFLGIYAY
jgi:hypothetical protein